LIAGWDTACPDWAERLANGQPIVPIKLPCPERAARAIKIFKRLRLLDVPGSPRLGEICAPWVFQFVAAMFGAYDTIEQRQIAREAFLLIAKKNSKSSIAAGIMVTALIMHTRRQEQFLIIAPTKDVADNSFDPARGMIEADEVLARRFKIGSFIREIEDRTDGAVLAVKAADADVVGGQRATCALIDELWIFGRKAHAANVIAEATGSLASRPDGFCIFLSSQSDEPPAGVFRQKLDYHRKVRDGIIKDPTCLPVIYEFPPAMVADGGWRKQDNWHIPNPNLGRSVDFAWLVSAAAKADHEGSDTFRMFAAKHLNVEVGIALRSDAWAGADYWTEQVDPALTLENIIERSDVICAGIDGGGLDDLMALGVLGRDSASRDWLLWNRTWAHPQVLARHKQEAPRLHDFARAGELVIVDRIGDDVEEIADLCARLDATGKLAQIGLDPMGVGAVLDALEARGLHGDRTVAISQGWRLAGAIKTAERRLAEGTLWHSGQAITAWAVGNAKVEQRGNAISITKAGAGNAKIDPLMALFDAVALMSNNPSAVRKPTFPMYFIGRPRGPFAAGPF
jgi:phage terminase large subunit-like protein